MASAVTSPAKLHPAPPTRHPATQVVLTGWGGLVTLLAFGAPFGMLGWYAYRAGFISNLHSHILSKVLLALDRGRLELIGFTYPPLPFILTLARPDPITLIVASAMAAGATMWLLWSHLETTRLSRGTKVMLAVLLATTPTTAYLTTQSFNETLAILLFLIAWRFYLAFTNEQATWQGFASGLVLGIAFYASAYTVLYGVLFALATPFFNRDDPHLERNQQFPALISKIVILAFPVLMALASWTYLNWLFTGRAFGFLSDPAAPVYAFLNPIEQPLSTHADVLLASLRDLIKMPVYVAIGFTIVFLHRRGLIVFVFPVLLITIVRALGFYYPEGFALTTYLVAGIAALPRQTRGIWDAILTIAAIVQIVVSVTVAPVSDEMKMWQRVLLSGQMRQADQFEIVIANRFRQAPDYSILADDRTAYRLVARTATARPFVLPADSNYDFVLSDPARHVRYILMATTADGVGRDPLGQRWQHTLPDGFAIEATWDGWRLLRRLDAPPLLVA